MRKRISVPAFRAFQKSFYPYMPIVEWLRGYAAEKNATHLRWLWHGYLPKVQA